jgi:hypothetical protein
MYQDIFATASELDYIQYTGLINFMTPINFLFQFFLARRTKRKMPGILSDSSKIIDIILFIL